MKDAKKRIARGCAVLVFLALVIAAAGFAYRAHRGREPRTFGEYATGLVDKGRELVTQVPGLLGKSKDLAEDFGSRFSSAKETGPGSEQEALGRIEVFFGPCTPINPRGIDDHFLNLLKSAERSIHAGFYDLQLPRAAEILIEKHSAGIDVKLVSDSHYEDRAAIQSCIRAGIPVVFDNRSPYMHNKFCVVDGTRVWTGSTNITENGMYKNDNNALLIASEKLADSFTREFEEMFDDKRFGGGLRNTRQTEIEVGDARIECYFAPEDGVQRAIVDEIKTAETSIDFMAFSFTSSDIAEAMAKRMKEGVRVRGLFEKRNAGSKHSRDEYLAGCGAEIHMDQNKYAMHHKVIIIDTGTVITGSYNFSKAAETKNDENVLIVHAPRIARKYRGELESLLPR